MKDPDAIEADDPFERGKCVAVSRLADDVVAGGRELRLEEQLILQDVVDDEDLPAHVAARAMCSSIVEQNVFVSIGLLM